MPLVSFATDDAIGVITLDRPEARNAQNPELLRDLDDAWRQAAVSTEVKVIVLRAHGDHFSAGHDLKAFDGLVLKDANLGSDVTFGGEGVGINAGYQWE